jgi:hypothetical protein
MINQGRLSPILEPRRILTKLESQLDLEIDVDLNPCAARLELTPISTPPGDPPWSTKIIAVVSFMPSPALCQTTAARAPPPSLEALPRSPGATPPLTLEGSLSEQAIADAKLGEEEGTVATLPRRPPELRDLAGEIPHRALSIFSFSP